MYRIELSPGEETVFRSIEELAVAIKRGVITPRARIYHNASQKWLPIQFHPHYKVAVSMPLTQAALVAGPPIKRLSNLTLQHPADPEPPAPVAPAPAPAPKMSAEVEPPVVRKKVRAQQPAKRARRQSKPRRQLRIALIGALLVGGAQWVLSAPLFSRTDAPLILARRHLITAPAEAMKQVSSPNSAGMIPVIHTPSAATVPATLASPMSPVATELPPEIEPAPDSIDVTAPATPKADSLTTKMADSTNKKALKGVLRAVSTTPTREKTSKR
jgi:hypothetical protein